MSLKNWWKRWTANPAPRPDPRASVRCRLGVESLEDRTVPGAGGALLALPIVFNAAAGGALLAPPIVFNALPSAS